VKGVAHDSVPGEEIAERQKRVCCGRSKHRPCERLFKLNPYTSFLTFTSSSTSVQFCGNIVLTDQ